MKQNLLKTMLVMAGIFAGSMGAWADAVVLNPTQTTVIHAMVRMIIHWNPRCIMM